MKLKTIHFQLPIDTLPFSLFNRISILSDTCVRQPGSFLPPALPELTVNRSFMMEFVTADTPCFALGLVEEGGLEYGFLGFRPHDSIPTDIANAGFGFGHTLLGDDTFEVIHFAFDFYGYRNYNVLLNPNNSLVRKVLQVMLTHQNYFFFALDSNSGNATQQFSF